MMRHFFLGFLPLVAGMTLCQCSSLSPAASTIELEQDSYVSENSQPPEPHKKGEKIVVGKAPVLVSADGYLGVLVLPERSYSGNIKVALKPVASSSGSNESVNRSFDKILSQVISEENRILTLISKKRGKEALARIEELETKYPRIIHFKFLKASTLYFLGEKESARGVLELALKESPEDPDGKALYKLLNGGARKVASEPEADTTPEVTHE